MKVTVLTENLKKGLSVIMRGITNRSSLPVLSGVLMKVKNDGLELMSTDLEISFRVKIGVKVKQEGEVVVPAKLLYDLVSGLPLGPVGLTVDKQALVIEGGGVKTEIVGQAAEEFPSLPKAKGKTLKLEVEEFKQKINKVVVSAARDETRPVLSGVLWSFLKDKVQLVATDGYRLSLDELKGFKGGEKMEGKKLILPARALQELSRILADGQIRELGVEFDEDGQQVIFVAETVEMVSRLIAGEFPPYQQILPEGFETKFEVNREELLEAVKRASLFSGEGASIVRVRIEKDKVKVMAESGQKGGSVTEIDTKTEGEGVEMAFNGRYLIDYLGVVDKEMVTMETEGELKPGVFRLAKESLVQVVMPIRLQQ